MYTSCGYDITEIGRFLIWKGLAPATSISFWVPYLHQVYGGHDDDEAYDIVEYCMHNYQELKQQ